MKIRIYQQGNGQRYGVLYPAVGYHLHEEIEEIEIPSEQIPLSVKANPDKFRLCNGNWGQKHTGSAPVSDQDFEATVPLFCPECQRLFRPVTASGAKYFGLRDFGNDRKMCFPCYNSVSDACFGATEEDYQYLS